VADVAGPIAVRVACLHLSLGAADQMVQLTRIADVLHGAETWVAMGDFNCSARSAPLQAFCAFASGVLSQNSASTYPAWAPNRDFDHIVHSQSLSLTQYRVEPARYSDHLAVSAYIGD
jgi:endonuclease/exonuclease/phosphatase family metal-dependent hydrolase